MRANRSRKHRVEVAMNDQEYEEFMKHVEECGLSKQSYLLQLIKNRIPQPLPSDDFQEVIRQLRRIGNNINQLARYVNIHKEEVNQEVLNEVEKKMADYVIMQDKLNVTWRKLMSIK